MHRILALGIRHQPTDRAGQAVDVLLEVEALVPELYNQLPILAGTQVLSDALCHILTTCDANTLSLALKRHSLQSHGPDDFTPVGVDGIGFVSVHGAGVYHLHFPGGIRAKTLGSGFCYL